LPLVHHQDPRGTRARAQRQPCRRSRAPRRGAGFRPADRHEILPGVAEDLPGRLLARASRLRGRAGALRGRHRARRADRRAVHPRARSAREGGSPRDHRRIQRSLRLRLSGPRRGDRGARRDRRPTRARQDPRAPCPGVGPRGPGPASARAAGARNRVVPADEPRVGPAAPGRATRHTESGGGMMRVDRRNGYYDKAKERMSAAARQRYQEAWLRDLLDLSWLRAPGVRRRLEAAALRPEHLGSLDSVSRLPVLRKSLMPELQQADPPFGGFCTVPISKLRRIFISPGPIYEPMGPEVAARHDEAAVHAGGFRPGDIVLVPLSYHLVPAGLELDESLQVMGCTVVPTGVGNTETQVQVALAVGATGYMGTPSFLMTLLKRAEEMKVG